MLMMNIEKNLCLIYSNFEESSIKQQSEIEQIFKTKFGIEKILFSTLKLDSLAILDKLEKFKADMPFHEHLNIKTTDLNQTIDPQFDLDCLEERNILQNFSKMFENIFR